LPLIAVAKEVVGSTLFCLWGRSDNTRRRPDSGHREMHGRHVDFYVVLGT